MAKLSTILFIVAALVGVCCLFEPLIQKVNSTKTGVKTWQLCGLVLLFCVIFMTISAGGL
ncbi:hypothetical protein ACKLNO_04390 [Neisseriaceae bacterium B1]